MPYGQACVIMLLNRSIHTNFAVVIPKIDDVFLRKICYMAAEGPTVSGDSGRGQGRA